MKILSKKRGFTLIELLLVIAIAATLGATSVVFFSRFLTQNAVINTQDQVVGQLRKAQLYALMGRENTSWGVAFSESKIILFQGTSFASRDTAFDEVFFVNQNINITGFSEVVFTKATGAPSTTGQFTVVGGDTTKQISLNSQGVVTR